MRLVTRRPSTGTAVLLLLVGLFLLPAAGADEEPPRSDIFPLSAVRPGMRGHALTVMSGTRLSRFDVEVIDVMHNFLCKQDVILVRCSGEEVERVGIAEGMSGSPVYIDGKIAGALAYTWSWAPEALAGVTPIEAMLAEGRRPLEGMPSGAAPATPLEERSVTGDGTAQDLRPIATPVCVSGFTPGGRARLAEGLRSLGLAVRAGGGAIAAAPRGWDNLDAPIRPGACVVAEMLRGDFSVAAVGTLTFVDGDRLHAFGHSFQGIGETLYPLSIGYVYTVVASRQIGFKLGSAIRPIGAIVQDRESGIVAHLGHAAPMVPFDVRMENAATKHHEDFHFEVTANRVFFQRMMLAALREAFNRAEATLGHNTKRYRLEVKLAGLDDPWSSEDTIVAFDGGLSRLLIGLVDRVMNHPAQRADFEWVKLHVEIENADRRAAVEAVAPSRDEVRAGESLDLRVRLRPREGGQAVVETLRIRVPADIEPGDYAFHVTGGDGVPADAATPVHIAEIPAVFGAFIKSTELVAVLPTGRVDLDMDGRLVRNLPLSAVPRLARSHEGANARLVPVTEKVRREVPYVITGSVKVLIRVLP